MPNYSKGKIYTIRCKNDTSLIYVGSTIQPLAKRWGEHKYNSLRNPEYLIYKTINNEWDNWYIELYELYPCNSKEELHKREGEITREIGNLNMCIAGRTIKEWCQENKDTIKEKAKERYNNNKETIKEKAKERYNNNKEKILERQKEYREDNKEKINEKKREKIICSCGGKYTNGHKSQHNKTKKHINYLATIEG